MAADWLRIKPKPISLNKTEESLVKHYYGGVIFLFSFYLFFVVVTSAQLIRQTITCILSQNVKARSKII